MVVLSSFLVIHHLLLGVAGDINVSIKHTSVQFLVCRHIFPTSSHVFVLWQEASQPQRKYFTSTLTSQQASESLSAKPLTVAERGEPPSLLGLSLCLPSKKLGSRHLGPPPPPPPPKSAQIDQLQQFFSPSGPVSCQHHC